MRNKILTIFIVLMLMIVVSVSFTGCSKKVDYETNLLTNSNFETMNDTGTSIASWVTSNTTAVTFKSNTRDDDYNVKLGSYYAKISLTTAGYAYIAQNVTLEKNTFYKITAYVKVDSIVETDGIGFRFGFDTNSDFEGYNIVDDTDDEWINVEYYFTSSTNKEVKFVIGVGSPNKTTTGTVYFDNVSLEKVQSIPADYLSENTIEVLKYSNAYSLSDGGSITFVVLLSIASVILALAIYLGIKKTNKSDIEMLGATEGGDVNSTPKQRSKFMEKINKYVDTDKLAKIFTSEFAMFLYVMIGSLLIRFIVVVCSFGMTSNITALESVSTLGMKGLLSFYSTNTSVTTPVGSTVLYTFLGYIASWMNIKTASLGYAILMRMPLILADIITTYMLYVFTAKHKSEKSAVVYSSIYAFVPLFFFFTSFYGATEGIAISFLIAMFISILDKDYIKSGIFYTIAFLFSNYALVILPIILIFEIYGIVKEEENRVAIIVTMVVGLVLVFVFGMLMTWKDVTNGDVFACFKRIYKFFQDSSYLTTDSFNIYAIFASANTKTRSTVIEVFNWLFVAAMSAWPAFLYIKNKNRSDLILNASLMLVAYAIVGAQSTTVILPMGLAILVLYLIIVPENRLYLSFMALSTLSFLNIAQLASQSGYVSNVSGATYTAFLNNSVFLILFSVITMLVFIYFIYVCIDVAYYNQSSDITPMRGSLKDEIKIVFKQIKPKKLSNKNK